MKRKLTIGITVTLLAAFAAALLIRDYRQSWQTNGSTVGQLIFPKLPVNAARNVIITAPSQQTVLQRQDQRWRVMNVHGYPADFEQLAPLVRRLPELKVVQSFVVAPDDYGRLQLNDPAAETPENAGLKLQVFDENERRLASLVLGKLHTNSEQIPIGRYLLLPERNSVVLVTEPFSQLDANPKHWLDRTFPQLTQLTQAGKIEKGTPTWTLKRSPQGAILLDADIPEGRAIDAERLDRARDVLSRMQFTDIGNPKRSDADWGFADRVFELKDKDGITYRFILGDLTEKRQLPVRIEMQFDEPPFQKPADTTQPTAVAQLGNAYVESIRETRERFKRESELYGDWVYLLPRASYEPMLYSVEDFLLPKR